MALFAIQLAHLIFGAMYSMNGNVVGAYDVIVGIYQIINVTISSVIVTYVLLTMWT